MTTARRGRPRKTAKLAEDKPKLVWRVQMYAIDAERHNYCCVEAINKKEAIRKALKWMNDETELRRNLRPFNAFPDVIKVELALHPLSIDAFVDQYCKANPEAIA